VDMGRVKTRVIKDVARKIIVEYWDIVKEIWDKSEEIAMFDPKLAAQFRFEMYKHLVQLTTTVQSKSVRNKIAGGIIGIMKQILYLGRISLEELAAKYKLKKEEMPEEEETVSAEAY